MDKKVWKLDSLEQLKTNYLVMDAALAVRLSTPEPPEPKDSYRQMALSIFFEIIISFN
jgi:hypothetical protein